MKKTFKGIFVLMALVLLVPLQASAQGTLGEANITPETTMREIRDNPSIIGSGVFTREYEQDCEIFPDLWMDRPLREYVGEAADETSAAALNRVVENYNKGVKITYQLYTDEEVAQDPTCAHAQLFYFPAENPNGKYAIVIGGNTLLTSGEIREGMATATRLNDLGYTAFVLRYRIGDEAAHDAPVKDLVRAVDFITVNADVFGVKKEDYAIFGFSSGGQIAGVFASAEYGWQRFGVQKPGALLLAYPVNSFFEAKGLWKTWIEPYADGQRYIDLDVSSLVTPDYPPVYHWQGRNDLVLGLICAPAQGNALECALKKNGVPSKYVLYANAPHAIGLGEGTDAEGWVDDAAAFWEETT